MYKVIKIKPTFRKYGASKIKIQSIEIFSGGLNVFKFGYN